MASSPNGYSYSSSKVMSYSNDGRGEPKYFEASSSTKTAPGGVKETQKTMRDSESGIHKMAVGHHIGECEEPFDSVVSEAACLHFKFKQDNLNLMLLMACWILDVPSALHESFWAILVQLGDIKINREVSTCTVWVERYKNRILCGQC